MSGGDDGGGGGGGGAGREAGGGGRGEAVTALVRLLHNYVIILYPILEVVTRVCEDCAC